MIRDILLARPGKIIVGLFMGLALVVPGVSAGTVALVLGVHREIVGDIARLRGTSLLPSIFGLLCGAWLGVWAIWHVLSTAPSVTLAFFLGLMGVAVGDFLWEKAPRGTSIWWMASGIIIAWFLGGQGTLVRASSGFLAMFLAGGISSGAMVLPGISGGSLLIVIGLYDDVISAFSLLRWPEVAWFGGGAVLGLFITAVILHWTLDRWEESILSFLMGLMAGSIWVLLPETLTAGVFWSTVAGGLLGVYLSRLGRRKRQSASRK